MPRFVNPPSVAAAPAWMSLAAARMLRPLVSRIAPRFLHVVGDGSRVGEEGKVGVEGIRGGARLAKHPAVEVELGDFAEASAVPLRKTRRTLTVPPLRLKAVELAPVFSNTGH